jgi:hypothetical protein
MLRPGYSRLALMASYDSLRRHRFHHDFLAVIPSLQGETVQAEILQVWERTSSLEKRRHVFQRFGREE